MGDFATIYPPPASQPGESGQTGPAGPTGPVGGTGYLKTTVITVTGTFTTGPSTTKIKVRVQGGGGGGGSAKGSYSVATGGSAGAYAEKTFTVTPLTGYSAVIGSGGPGGDATVGPGNNNGTNGGDSTFTVGLTTVTSPGGPGGHAGRVATSGGADPTVSDQTDESAQATNGDINGAGECGDPGIGTGVQPFEVGGKGGSSSYGPGGAWCPPNTVHNAVGNGGGGAGGCDDTNVGSNGGNGTSGIIVIDEFA